MTNTLLIQTPEGIVFPLLLAGPVTRFFAWFIDLACMAVMVLIVGIFLNIIGLISIDISYAFSFISYFSISIGYPIVTEWFWRGQTLGKRALHLRVMDAQGLRLQFSQVVIRNLLRFIDSLPPFYVTGGLCCLFSRHFQRLGDIAANTVVIRNPQVFEPNVGQLTGGKYNSFREYPHLAARLRQRVSPHEATIALEALMRREQLDPLARIQLFGEIASHMKRVIEFPQEATDGITEEQYVRNVVDILFRRDRL